MLSSEAFLNSQQLVLALDIIALTSGTVVQWATSAAIENVNK